MIENTNHLALILLSIIWIGLISYKLRSLATVKCYEEIILLPFLCAPIIAVFYIAETSFLAVWISILIGWIGILVFDNGKKRVGSFSHKGWMRILALRRHKGILVRSADDLNQIDILVLSTAESKLLKSNTDSELNDLVAKAVSLDKEIIQISTFLQDNYGYLDHQGVKNAQLIGIERSGVLRELKRVLDFLIVLFLLVAAIPTILLIVIILLIFQGRPILFQQERLGKDGRIFKILKFRTMSDPTGKNLDVTKIGLILRLTHLDELPQLINVLRGDMAMVGPRPEWVLLSTAASAPASYQLRQVIRPGLTGWAQILYKPSRTKSMRQRKLGHDLYYAYNRSIMLDVLIWFRTILKLLSFFFSFFSNQSHRRSV